MKLSEYFKHQQSQKMPAHIKSELFSRIQKEKNWIEISTKIPSKTFFFASKRIVYTSLAVALVFVVFGWLILDKTEVVDFGIFSVKQSNTPNGVFADYVAEIVEFNGEYSLVRNGKTVLNSDKLNTIQDGDIVSFPEWTDLLFNLTDWTQAKIVWPAEFSIVKTKKWYQISLFDGKFFRIYSPECKSDMEIITPDFSISQEKDQILDIHIAKEENGEMLVKNDGDKITVKTKHSEETEIKQISSELVAINPDSETIDVVEDSEVMLNFLAKNNISATFTLSTENVEWPTIKSEQQNNLIAIEMIQQSNNSSNSDINYNKTGSTNTEHVDLIVTEEKDPLLDWLKEVIFSDKTEVWEMDENVALQLWLTSEDDKKVPTTDQMQALKTNLNSFFLMNIFENIYNNDRADQNISKFADRINAISYAFWYSSHASSDLFSIKSTIQSLKSQLENERYISPSYILQIEKVVRWCDELQNPSKLDWESLKSDLPTSLRLM